MYIGENSRVKAEKINCDKIWRSGMIVSEKEWEYMQTEEYAKVLEMQEKQWDREEEDNILKKINYNLELGTKEARNVLTDMFRNEEFIKKYSQRNHIAGMIVVMEIYEKEKQMNEEITILDVVKSCEEVKSLIMQLKFILWRLEFKNELQAKEVLTDYILNRHLSPCMIQYMVCISNWDKNKVLIQLSNHFLDRNMYRYAYGMLHYLQERLPKEEAIKKEKI